ncbi:MAG: hypothetical protein ACK41D_09655 [Rubricoccaceae bacterium]
MPSRFLPALLVLLLALPLAPPAAAQITADAEPLVVGRPVTLTLPAPAERVVVTYRPGSRTSSSDTLAADGTQVAWTPRAAGLVQVSYGTARTTLSVRYARVPLSGLFVLVAAGAILFGGAGLALAQLLRGAPAAPRRADT